MGYTTQFQGVVKITPELKTSQVKFIQGMFGDMREWNPEEAKRLDFTWFDFEFNEEMDGLQWDGTEKFYDADTKMQYLIDRAVEKYPELSFNGILQAQGEEIDDRWQLVVNDNKVKKVEVTLKGKIITCPRCEEKFELEEV